MIANRCSRLISGLLLIATLGLGCGGNEATSPQPPGSHIPLAFQQSPTLVERGRTFTLSVLLPDQGPGLPRRTHATAQVHIALSGQPNRGHLGGTTTVDAVRGIATFDDLQIDSTGVGYTLIVSGEGFDSAVSPPFDVVLPFVQIAPGAFHTCGRTGDGKAYCWGDGAFLGDGTGTARARPGLVAGNHVFTTVSTGYSSCGLEVTGAVYCWQGGPPVLVSADYPFTVLETGNLGTSCALTDTGVAYCWGSNAYGALGDGTMLDHDQPAPVLTDLRFQMLTVGAWHVCGLTDTHDAFCWGYNDYGALGDGTTITRTTPVPVAADLAFVQISAGRYHSCGVTTDGAAYCWGRNARGELGDGSDRDRSAPVRVDGAVAFASISAGGEQTCALTSAGVAYCWGIKVFGNRGEGTRVDRQSTNLVVTDVLLATLSTGINQHNCGLRSTGAAFCWGLGSNGQLGNGMPYFLDAPTPVINP